MSLDAMKQALHTLEGWANHGDWVWPESALEQAKRNTTESITALRAAIEQAQEPVAFDHEIGIDRFKVVRGAFWWHVLIGDSPTEHGKFRSRASAEKMAADLLREFRNGAFVQHDAALAEPVQEPVAYIHRLGNHFEVSERHLDEDEKARGWTEEPLYAHPPQRPVEPVQEPFALPCPTPKACKAHCCSGNCIPRSKA